MLFIPSVLQGPFDRRYVIAHFSFPGSPENFFGDRSAASQLIRQLRAPSGFWESLVASRSEYDLRYLRVSPEELVTNLLASSRLQAYALPTDAELEAFSSYSRYDSSNGFHYRLLPRNGHLLSGVEAITPYSRGEFDGLLQRLGLSDQQLRDITNTFPSAGSGSNTSPRSRLFKALLNYELVATATLVSSPVSPEGSGADDTTYAPRQTNLGPHDRPGYVAPPPAPAPAPATITVPKSAPNTRAQSLEECEQRLVDAKARLKAHGYVPKYTDEELLTIAQKGELDDRFIVRFNKTQWLTDDNHLSRPDTTDGSTRTWVTTFNQIENADTDPRIVASVLGIIYDPNADCSLVIVDTSAPEAAQAVTIVPTYKNLGEMAKNEIKDIDPALVDQVMTEEYSKVYAEAMEAFEAEGLNMKKSSDVRDFASSTFDSPDDVARFETRILIEQQYGANPNYTGNGTTKNLLAGDGNCGVMEVLNVDKNPRAVGKLIGSGAARRLACMSS